MATVTHLPVRRAHDTTTQLDAVLARLADRARDGSPGATRVLSLLARFADGNISRRALLRALR